MRGGGNTSFLLISISMKSFRQNNSRRWFFLDKMNKQHCFNLISRDGLVQYQFVAQWNGGDWPVIVCHLSTSSSGDHHRKVVLGLYSFIYAITAVWLLIQQLYVVSRRREKSQGNSSPLDDECDRTTQKTTKTIMTRKVQFAISVGASENVRVSKWVTCPSRSCGAVPIAMRGYNCAEWTVARTKGQEFLGGILRDWT